MAEIKSVVCDVCGSAPAETWMVARKPNTPWVVDLCEEHAGPLASTRQYGRHNPTRRTYRRYGKVPAEAP